MNQTIVTTHSAGVNWPQALAIWVPIVLGIVSIGALIYRGVSIIAQTTVEKFASTLNVKLTEIDNHLKRQDERLNEIDGKRKRRHWWQSD